MKKKKLPYWNHNTAYYPWIARQTADCRSVLDVGCGDGTLAMFLWKEGRTIVGIDPFPDCIRRASMENEKRKNDVCFINGGFEEYPDDKEFDAIVFVASLHHLSERDAIRKAKAMLHDGGRLLIVGLAKPSSVLDDLIEALRVVPSFCLSKLHGMKPCEKLDIPVSDKTGTMKQIRSIVKEELPGAKMRQALHYRYLLSYRKPIRK